MMYVPDGSAMLNAFVTGQRQLEQRQALEEESAQREARRGVGAAMAAGNYDEAARLAYEGGDLGTGYQLQQRGQEAALQGRKRAALKQFETDPDAALTSALEIDPDFYSELRKIGDERKLAKAKQWGGILRAIAAEPEEMWDDHIGANRAQLEALDIPAAEIDGFIRARPEDRRVLMSTMLSRADMLDKYLDQRDKDRTFQATQADREADNKRADAQLGIARANLGVSQGNLAQRRAEHAARMAGKGGYAAPGGASYDDVPAGAVVVPR